MERGSGRERCNGRRKEEKGGEETWKEEQRRQNRIEEKDNCRKIRGNKEIR